jgi:hypothetical protein
MDQKICDLVENYQDSGKIKVQLNGGIDFLTRYVFRATVDEIHEEKKKDREL